MYDVNRAESDQQQLQWNHDVDQMLGTYNNYNKNGKSIMMDYNIIHCFFNYSFQSPHE